MAYEPIRQLMAEKQSPRGKDDETVPEWQRMKWLNIDFTLVERRTMVEEGRVPGL